MQFLAHVTVFGTVEELKAQRGIVTNDGYREVLVHAPAGVFDVGILEFGLRPTTHASLADAQIASDAPKAR